MGTKRSSRIAVSPHTQIIDAALQEWRGRHAQTSPEVEEVLENLVQKLIGDPEIRVSVALVVNTMNWLSTAAKEFQGILDGEWRAAQKSA